MITLIDHFTETQVNSIVSEMEIVKMNCADIVSKVDVVLSNSKYRGCLTQDQEIDLGLLKVNMQKQIEFLEETIKKI